MVGATVDIDLKIIPKTDEVLWKLSEVKERLHINVKLASPDRFIPALPSWQDRSRFIQQEGKLTFFHYDFYAQALAKIERGHQADILDLRQMMKNSFIEPTRLLDLFCQIETKLYRYPALNPKNFGWR